MGDGATIIADLRVRLERGEGALEMGLVERDCFSGGGILVFAVGGVSGDNFVVSANGGL